MADSAWDRGKLEAGLFSQVWDLGDLAVKKRLLEAIDAGVSRFPIYRDTRFAAFMTLDALFDDLATTGTWQAQRLSARTLVLSSDEIMIVAHGGQKESYCSCYFSVWASSVAEAERAIRAITERAGDALIREPMFSINWSFLTANGELESVTIEEFADDKLYDEAYPGLSGGVAAFIESYLASEDNVLVLQGPPGTGKTRFIRAILGQMSRANGGTASALYTGDKKTLERDEIFVRFITGWEHAFVIEDADHLLMPRAEGNENLHRFLAIADGVVRAQGRKIIFSTNLPNIGDIDEALIRPGRCFARLEVRNLQVSEALPLVAAMCRDDPEAARLASESLGRRGRDAVALAEVYKLVRESRSEPAR